MFNQRSLLLIFIDRFAIYMYGGGAQGIITVQIPDTIVFDFEVLSKDSLYSLVKQWVKQYGLIGSQIVFVFSETVYFEKIFLTSDVPQMETQILKFFDMVPYESIWSKVYPVKNGKRAIAFNKTFFDGIHQGFLLQGLPVKSIIPAFALGQYEKEHTLSSPLAVYITEHLDQLSKFNVLDSFEYSAPTAGTSSEVMNASTVKKSNLPLLLSVFGFLLLALGGVIYLQYR